jgi:hypothetical protein
MFARGIAGVLAEKFVLICVHLRSSAVHQNRAPFRLRLRRAVCIRGFNLVWKQKRLGLVSARRFAFTNWS